MDNISINIILLVEIIILILFLFLFTKFTLIIIIILILIYLYLQFSKNPATKIDPNTKFQSIEYYPSFTTTYHLVNKKMFKIGKNDILVKTFYASINPLDYKINYNIIPFYRYFVYLGIGFDIVGQVIEIGNNIKNIKIGDYIYGKSESGSLSEYSICSEKYVVNINNISNNSQKLIQIAGLPLVGVTALQCLKFFNNIENKDVLIVGASGGVGHIAIQLCKYLKANKIYGVCSSKNFNLIQKFTQNLVDYGSDLQSQFNQQNFDLIFDTVSSFEDGDKQKVYNKFLKENGCYIKINSDSILEFGKGILNSYCHINFERKNNHVHLLKWNLKDLEQLYNIFNEEQLTIFTDIYQFSLENVNEGFNKLKSRRTTGKIIYEFK